MALSTTTIRSIQDIMRKDVGIDGDAQRIGQLVWMLFLKIYDHREAEQELLDDDYESPIPEELRWRNWAAAHEGITGGSLLDFVDSTLFPRLKDLSGSGLTARRAVVVRRVFADAHNYMKNGALMRKVINKLNADIDFGDSKQRHALGDIYEQILKDLQSAGSAGEYYTPRAVAQFAVEMINPQLGETILDPACGTGGFLACAIDHLRKQVKTPKQEQGLQSSIHGVEKKQLPHLLCTTNMILHGIDIPTTIRHDNLLAQPLPDYGKKDRVDVIVTNPPFGGMEEDGIENNFPADFRTRETADLFLLLIVHLLKPGGRAAVVLPDGTLFGEGIKARIKQKLMEECKLHTVVRLPKGVFAPYTDIQTNVLFFEKGEPTKHTWFYEHPYPQGYRSYSKTKPIRVEEFAAEREWWPRRRAHGQAWRVAATEVVDRGYNLDCANPAGRGTVQANPEPILKDYENAQKAVDEISERLRLALNRALSK